MNFEEALSENDRGKFIFNHNGFMAFPRDILSMQIGDEVMGSLNYIHPYEPDEFEIYCISSLIE